MQPLDLLKVKFQVTTQNPPGGIGKYIWHSLKDIQQTQGWRGLYRGIIPNIAGNASSWGLYFLLCVPLQRCTRNTPNFFTSYNMLKKRASGGDLNKTLTAAEYLICSAQASSHFLFALQPPRTSPG
jgi:solute carrier family 25 folate transporter 32